MIGKIIAIAVVGLLIGVAYYYLAYLPYQKVGTLKVKVINHFVNSGNTKCLVKVLEADGNTDGIKVGDTIPYPKSFLYSCAAPIGDVDDIYVWANGEILQRK